MMRLLSLWWIATYKSFCCPAVERTGEGGDVSGVAPRGSTLALEVKHSETYSMGY